MAHRHAGETDAGFSAWAADSERGATLVARVAGTHRDQRCQARQFLQQRVEFAGGFAVIEIGDDVDRLRQ